MANYAKTLIGNWETSQYEPKRQSIQNIYNTNWNKLQTDFNALNEQLQQNFNRARLEHNQALEDVSSNSYNRMYNVEQNLANRGLTGSNLLNVYNTSNIRQKGEEADKNLQTLMDANKAASEGRIEGLNTYATNVDKLAGDLANDLAGVTNAETQNLQNYYDLLSSVTESANERASKYSKQNAERELEELEDRVYRVVTIKEILENADTSDTDKFYELTTDADLTSKQAEKILSTYNYNKTQSSIESQKNKVSELSNMPFTTQNIKLDKLLGKARLNKYNSAVNTLNDYNNQLKNYTYTDLKSILENL